MLHRLRLTLFGSHLDVGYHYRRWTMRDFHAISCPSLDGACAETTTHTMQNPENRQKIKNILKKVLFLHIK